MGYEEQLREQLDEISKNQKDTNNKLTMLMDKLVGDPLSKRKGWVTIIEENSEDVSNLKNRIDNLDIRIDKLDERVKKIEEKKSKVGATLLATIGAGGSCSMIGANWSSIKKFILNVLNGL